jgi:hypothetical protein
LGGRNYHLCAVVAYRPFGATLERFVRVTAITDDVKNRCPGFSGYCVEEHDFGSLVDDGDVWGYDDQITRVLYAGKPPYPFYIEIHPDDADDWQALDEGPFSTAADAFAYARAEVGVDWRVVKKMADGVYVGLACGTGHEVTDGEW